jgi:ribonuclease HI
MAIIADGASCQEGSGIELLLVNPEGKEMTHTVKLTFKASNNECEYEALMAGLHLAHKNNAQTIHAYVESLLVANQINEAYEAKDATMEQYLHLCKEIMKGFQACEVVHVLRSQNKKANALSKLASCFEDPNTEVKIEDLTLPSIHITSVCAISPWEKNWMTPILEYITKGHLRPGRAEAMKIRNQALQYEVLEGSL